MVPFHFQQVLGGDVILDVTLTNAVFNTGLTDSVFTLQ
jgi:outer membrane lipoprotein-sorting protein